MFKAGDEVVVFDRRCGYLWAEKKKVERVTATGTVIIAGVYERFEQDGRPKRVEKKRNGYPSIRQVTPESVADMEAIQSRTRELQYHSDVRSALLSYVQKLTIPQAEQLLQQVGVPLPKRSE